MNEYKTKKIDKLKELNLTINKMLDELELFIFVNNIDYDNNTQNNNINNK